MPKIDKDWNPGRATQFSSTNQPKNRGRKPKLKNIPDNVLTSARIGKICTNAKSDLRIKYAEAEKIKQLDGLKALGKGLFGGGFLLSRAAAERAAINIELSQRELSIVNKLG